MTFYRADEEHFSVVRGRPSGLAAFAELRFDGILIPISREVLDVHLSSELV